MKNLAPIITTTIALGTVGLLVFGAIDPYKLEITKSTTDGEIEKIIINSAIAGDKPTFVISVNTKDKERIEMVYKKIVADLNINLGGGDYNIYNHIRKQKQLDGVEIRTSKNSAYEAKTLKEYSNKIQ